MRPPLAVLAAAVAGCMLLGAQPAHADPARPGPQAPAIPGTSAPSPLQAWIDHTIPAPHLTSSRSAAEQQSALWRALLPTPSGDPLFDAWPANLAGLRPGQLIETRDVTATTATVIPTPISRAVLMKFRSTSATGQPSFGTATLIVPAAPWTGSGQRPVQVSTLPINSLGSQCNPSYAFAHRVYSNQINTLFLPTVWLSLTRGYAVLVPDHEGPLRSYAEPNIAGHVVLDSIRAVRSLSGNDFGRSRFVVSGYSGGSVASYAAAVLLQDYAPDLVGALVGVSMGGSIVDYSAVAHAMNGNPASGILMTVVLAMAREHPEMLPYMNHLAQWLATSPLKNDCGDSAGVLGALSLPVDIAANVDHALDSPIAAQIYRETDLTGRKSAVPLYIYHGVWDIFIPLAPVEQFYQRQCGMGVPAVFRTLPGEHVLTMYAGYPGAADWVDARLDGQPAPNECPERH